MLKKVLLIEDDPTMLSLLDTLLEIEGYQVVQVQASTQALESLEREQPDLVLMDIHLRDGDGFSLLRAIRQREDLQGLRVLMSSGMDFSALCEQEGADGFILKPYMPDELMEKIRQLLASD